MRSLKEFAKLAAAMIHADQGRNDAFDEYDAMYHVDWQLPGELVALEWVRCVRNMDPHDAVSTGTRVLSSLIPKIKYQPLNPAAKAQAGEWEKNLRWQMQAANRRRATKVERSVVMSALRYMAVAVQVVDLDYQIEQYKFLNAKSLRLKAARRHGRFMVLDYNPQVIHVRTSGLMTEAVLLACRKPAQEVVDDWGDRAPSALRKLAKDGQRIEYYDFTDYEDRGVWCTAIGGGDDDEKVMEIVREAHKLPFLPWVALMGKSTLESDGKDEYQPMYYPLMKSGVWKTTMIASSLAVSDVLARASYPRYAEEGVNQSEETQIDYTDPSRVAKVPVGNTLRALPPEQGDPALQNVVAELQGQMAKSTVSRILQGGEGLAGEAFAALNLRTQTAVGALKPAKELAEQALAEVFTLMLLWAHYTENDLSAYGTGKFDVGENYVIPWNAIDPSAIYLTVSLTADLPTDQMARLNAGMMANRLGVSKETIMEDVGIEDPDSELENWYLERYTDEYVALQVAAMQGEQQMQMQQAAQEQAAVAAQTAQAGMSGVAGQGQGYNPAMGGTPAAVAYPGMTREGATGVDMSGNPIAEQGP